MKGRLSGRSSTSKGKRKQPLKDGFFFFHYLVTPSKMALKDTV